MALALPHRGHNDARSSYASLPPQEWQQRIICALVSPWRPPGALVFALHRGLVILLRPRIVQGEEKRKHEAYGKNHYAKTQNR